MVLRLGEPRLVLRLVQPTTPTAFASTCITAAMDDIPPPSFYLRLPSPLSEKEAMLYYASLPSCPRLIARTGPLWKAPTGPEAYRKIRELRTVGNHALKDVWEDNLALKVHALLDSMEVKWTSTDVVRIGNAGEESSAPVILWIGVVPMSLCGDDGLVVASKCRELLVEYDITDVDVEIRESIVTRSAGPKLLKPASYFDPTAEVREPLTTTLGLPVCAQSTPWVEGTGGFFITEGGNTERLLLVTTRHVVFTPDRSENKHFECKDDSRYNVTLFSDAAFHKYLNSIKAKIEDKVFMVKHREERISAVEGRDDPEEDEQRQHIQRELDEAKKAIEKLNPFYKDVSTRWATPESRLLGHVILSPPINVGSEGYTEDWAVIEIDPSKIDASNFKGNAIDLGTRISVGEFTRMMYSNPRNARRMYSNPQSADSFEYPHNRLLKLKDTIPDEEMRHPTALDQNNNPYLMVIKRGNTTGLTVGRANDICSYARYNDNDKAETSKEWAILPFDSKSGAFSDKGDSGSVIVDSRGRIGGLLTGGAANIRSPPDITYATPISFLLKRLQDNGLCEPNVNPVLTA